MKYKNNIFRKYPEGKAGYNNGNYIEEVSIRRIDENFFLEEYKAYSDFDYCVKRGVFQTCRNCSECHSCNFEGNLIPEEKLQERITKYISSGYEEVEGIEVYHSFNFLVTKNSFKTVEAYKKKIREYFSDKKLNKVLQDVLQDVLKSEEYEYIYEVLEFFGMGIPREELKEEE